MATIRKLKSGNFQAQIRLSGLKPITKTFPTKTLATKFVREVEGDIKLQQALGKPIVEKISFREVVDLYMAKFTNQDTVNTISRLNWWCNHFGDIPIVSIDEFMVDDLLVEKNEEVTGSTCKRYKSTISAVFGFFMKHPKYKRLAIPNPVLGASVTKFSENPAKERFLSIDEQERLLDACKNTDWDKMYLLVLMALTTGARRGDLLKLKWSDIDFSSKLAQLLRGTTKNKQARMMPLTGIVIEELKRFRKIGETLIFNNSIQGSGKPMEYRKSLANAMKEAKINNCRFHDLSYPNLNKIQTFFKDT